ncbi:MAG: EamA family transporter [Bacteroidetes bacterium HGW-Bacteroidetes-8]|jgi:drug/metabolite transporter (DMT)-like permease|nr:MAG: EamA family transporter [Bacteroidetes bacterium HGW-Bacteroidetes-8]
MIERFISLPPKTRGVILILVANIFFAFNMPVSRELTPDWIDPFGLSLLRISFAFFAFFTLSKILKTGVKFTIKEHYILIISGILGTTTNQLSFLVGLSKSSPVDASLIITVTPIITMIFAALIIKEPITAKKLTGVIIGMGGATLILYVSYSGLFIQSGTLTGNLTVLISCFVYGLYLVLIRPLMIKYPPIEVMKWTFFYGMLASLPFTWKYVAMLPGAGKTQYLQLGYALFFGTFTAYLLVAFALKLLRPTTVSMFNYIQPLLASLIAVAIGQDTLNWTKPVSALLIFTGVYLVITSKSKDEIEKGAELKKKSLTKIPSE